MPLSPVCTDRTYTDHDKRLLLSALERNADNPAWFSALVRGALPQSQSVSQAIAVAESVQRHTAPSVRYGVGVSPVAPLKPVPTPQSQEPDVGAILTALLGDNPLASLGKMLGALVHTVVTAWLERSKSPPVTPPQSTPEAKPPAPPPAAPTPTPAASKPEGKTDAPDPAERKPAAPAKPMPGSKAKSQLDEDAEDGEDDPNEQAELIAELLQAVFGDDADSMFDRAMGEQVERYYADSGAYIGYAAQWQEMLHPRGKGGRFIEKHSAEAVSAAKVKIKQTLRGQKTPEGAKQLAEHLSLLSVKQLHDLKKQYGLKASGKVKSDLVAKLAERLHKGRREEAEEKSEMKAPEGKAEAAQQLPKEEKAEETPKKEPHEMTQEEFAKANPQFPEKMAAREWRHAVAEAADEGKKVDPQFFEDYPSLRPNWMKSKPEEIRQLYDYVSHEHLNKEYQRLKDEAGNAAKAAFRGPLRNRGEREKAALQLLKEAEKINPSSYDADRKRMESIRMEGASLRHKRDVKQAVEAGKPVPPEVLKLYPDLQPKPASPPAPEAKGEQAKPAPAAPQPATEKKPQAKPPTTTKPTPANPAAKAPQANVLNAIESKLDNRNYMNMADLKAELPAMSTQEFHNAIQDLRKQGVLELGAGEGRNGFTEAEQAAGMREEGSLLLWASVKDHDKFQQMLSGADAPQQTAKKEPDAAPEKGKGAWAQHASSPVEKDVANALDRMGVKPADAKGGSLSPEHFKKLRDTLKTQGKGHSLEQTLDAAESLLGKAQPQPTEEPQTDGEDAPPASRASERQAAKEPDFATLAKQAVQSQTLTNHGSYDQPHYEATINHGREDKTYKGSSPEEVLRQAHNDGVDPATVAAGVQVAQTPGKKQFTTQEMIDAWHSQVGKPGAANGDSGSTQSAVYSGPAPTKEKVRESADRLKKILGEKEGMQTLHELRDQMPDLSRQEFDEAAKQLWRDGTHKLVSINNPWAMTREEIVKSVPGVGETLAYIEPKDAPAAKKDDGAQTPGNAAQEPDDEKQNKLKYKIPLTNGQEAAKVGAEKSQGATTKEDDKGDKKMTQHQVFHGSGRDDKKSVYSPHAQNVGGVMGDDVGYYAFDEASAKNYGPNVQSKTVSVAKPLTMATEPEWRALTKAAGVPYDLGFGTLYKDPSGAGMREQQNKLKDYLRKQGHDALIVKVPLKAPSKTLSQLFGHDQLITLNKKDA